MTRVLGPFLVPLLLATGLTGCEAMSEGLQSSTDVVARAAELELTVDETAQLLSDQTRLPANPQVVEAVANLWIDYSLLSLAMHRDSSLQSLDLTPVVQKEIQQLKVHKLRDSVIQPDTALDEDRLRQLYEEELPEARVRARHILLSYPEQATDEQRDSVEAVARDLRERVQAGEDFAALAREYSDDRGTAPDGGDLGWFERGEMVRPFEEAALATEPGEVSEPVESPYGIHLIQVYDRDVRPFEQIRSGFRSRTVRQRVAEAESAYVAAIEDSARIAITDEAFRIVRELSRRPHMRLSRRAGNRELVEHAAGAVTAAEFKQYIQARPPGFRRQLITGEDRRIETILRGLTRVELLINAADEEGLEISESERDSLLVQARNQVVHSARGLKLWPVEPEAGESLEDAIDRTVRSTIDGMLRGEEGVLGLGNVAYALRQNLSGDVYAHNFSRVIDRVEEIKPGSPGRPKIQPQRGGQAPQGPVRAPNAPPDTTGG